MTYNYAAAQELVGQLNRAIEKLEWLAWLRDSQRSARLGDPTSDNWSGQRRQQFEAAFRREQAHLRALADRARHLRGAVTDEISQERAAEVLRAMRNHQPVN